MRSLLLCPSRIIGIEVVDGALGFASVELIDVRERYDIRGSSSSHIEASPTCTKRRHGLLLQIFADGGEVDHGLNAKRIECCGVSDTGYLKECWGHYRASGEDDFLASEGGIRLASVICLLEINALSRLFGPTSCPINLSNLMVDKGKPVYARVFDRSEIGCS